MEKTEGVCAKIYNWDAQGQPLLCREVLIARARDQCLGSATWNVTETTGLPIGNFLSSGSLDIWNIYFILYHGCYLQSAFLTWNQGRLHRACLYSVGKQ